MIAKYLGRYAEAETGLAASVPGRYRAALVVPALGESPALLEGYRAAARGAGGRILIVLVVNARASARPSDRAANEALLAALKAEGAPSESLPRGALLREDPDFDVLAVDRTSAGRELPPKQGVGLARKIGMDLALALVDRGKVDSPWLFGTDADTTLPGDYFVRAPGSAVAASARLFPFQHTGRGADPVTRATLRYELSLRYHVLGLAAAGSPYAYQSLGSTTVVDARAYAAVRGVPKREAGEDFYLLDKLAKVAPLVRLAGEPLGIRARRSERAPFGTGPGVAEVLERGDVWVAHPDAFARLGSVLGALEAFAAERDGSALRRAMAALELDGPLDALGFFVACSESSREVGGGDLRRRLHTWLDARRTLRLLHALRARGCPDLPLARALDRAPFVAGIGALDASDALTSLTELEARLPVEIGPSAPSPSVGSSRAAPTG